MSDDSEPVADSDPEADELPPLEELAEIVAQLRDYVSYVELSGADGLPRQKDLKERLAANPLPDWNQTARDASPHDASSRDVAPHNVSSRDAATSSRDAAPHDVSSRDVATLSRDAAPHDTAPSGKTGRAPQKIGDVLLPESAAEGTADPSPVQESALIHLGTTLHELRDRVADCTKCSLHETRKQTVFSRGQGTSGLCFVGEGPGAEEDAQGEPFVGAAGQLLDKMIQAMGFDRDEVYVCNIVKCRPPGNRKPSLEEMQTCSGYLHRQLELLEPQVIVALGGTAVEGLLGLTQGITRTRGKFRLYQGRIAVMPTFHPAYLLRNPAAKRQVWTDLRQVVRHMGRPLP